jgi:hypothetical protein
MSKYVIFYSCPVIYDVRGIENHVIDVDAPDMLSALNWFAEFADENMLPLSMAFTIIPGVFFKDIPIDERTSFWEKEVAKMVATGGMFFVRLEDLIDD